MPQAAGFRLEMVTTIGTPASTFSLLLPCKLMCRVFNLCLQRAGIRLCLVHCLLGVRACTQGWRPAHAITRYMGLAELQAKTRDYCKAAGWCHQTDSTDCAKQITVCRTVVLMYPCAAGGLATVPDCTGSCSSSWHSACTTTFMHQQFERLN